VSDAARRWIVPALYGAAVLFTFTHYGVTWDESVQSRYGELTLRYFASGFRDHAVNQFRDLRYYGPLFEALAALFSRLAPAHMYEIRHLFIALTGVAAVIGAGRFCRRAGADPLAGQLLLVLNPQFYGHAFNNSKDVPLACAAVWTMVAGARLLDRSAAGEVAEEGESDAGRADSLRRLAATALPFGLALGAAMAIRAGAIVLVGVMFAAVAITRRWRALVPLALGLPLAWLVMVAFWPWAHQSPILHPLEAMRVASHFPVVYPVLFEGHEIASDQLPVRYLVEMLALTTPLATLTLLVLGLGRVVRRLDPAGVLAACWFLLPVILFVLLRPNVYDGIRHFLFIVPAMAILGAAGLAILPRSAIVVTLLPLIAMLRLHPYESAYYNVLADARRFDTDYWASSYREAALWLQANRCPSRPTRVLVAATAISRECLTAYLDPRAFTVARTVDRGVAGALPADFDYYVATTRFGFANNYPCSQVVKSVGRMVVAYSVIRGGCR
jgi:hypothetical protein